MGSSQWLVVSGQWSVGSGQSEGKESGGKFSC